MPWVRAYSSAPTLPSMPRIAEPAGDADRVDVGQVPGGALRGLRTRRRAPSRMLTLASWAKPPARSASATDR